MSQFKNPNDTNTEITLYIVDIALNCNSYFFYLYLTTMTDKHTTHPHTNAPTASKEWPPAGARGSL